MPSRSEHTNCWIEVGTERYGPLTCELEEDAGSLLPQAKHSWSGTLTFGSDANKLPTGILFSEDNFSFR